MDYRTLEEPEFGILEIAGEIEQGRDLVLVQNAARELIAAKRTVALNLTRASFARASVCGLLVSLVKESRKYDTTLVLIIEPDQSIQKILRAAGIDRLVHVFSSMKLLLAWVSPESALAPLTVAV